MTEKLISLEAAKACLPAHWFHAPVYQNSAIAALNALPAADALALPEVAAMQTALERIGGVKGPYGFPFPEANPDYGSFAVMEARETLAALEASHKKF